MAWQDLATKQKALVLDAIPSEWRLKEMPSGDSVMSIPKESGILTPEELAITESYAVDLVKDLASGKLTSVAVTTAFCKRAALAHQTVCLEDPRANEVVFYALTGVRSTASTLFTQSSHSLGQSILTII